MYTEINSCIRVKGQLTDFFDIATGVRQGGLLSLILFIHFINDMYDFMPVDYFKLFLLLFADDTVLLSYSQEGLQLLLKLNDYTNEWRVTADPGRYFTQSPQCWFSRRTAQLYYYEN